MNSSQNGRVWTAVVEQNNRSRQREGTGCNLQEEGDNNKYPDPEAVRLSLACVGRGYKLYVRYQGISSWEHDEKVLVAFCRAESTLDLRVDGEWKDHAYYAEDRCREPDGLRSHS